MNNINILGTITRDIETRQTNGGLTIASFGIAWNKKVKQTDGSYTDKAHFFEVTAFGKKGEIINNHFGKGDRILINGELAYDSWTGTDGAKKSKTYIALNDFDFYGSNKNGGQGGGNRSSYSAPHQEEESPSSDVPEIDINEDEIPF